MYLVLSGNTCAKRFLIWKLAPFARMIFLSFPEGDCSRVDRAPVGQERQLLSGEASPPSPQMVGIVGVLAVVQALERVLALVAIELGNLSEVETTFRPER